MIHQNIMQWIQKYTRFMNSIVIFFSVNVIHVRNDRQYKRRRTVDQAQGIRDFNVENPPKVERKKPRAPASKSSLYRVRLQTSGIYKFSYPKTTAYKKYI